MLTRKLSCQLRRSLLFAVTFLLLFCASAPAGDGNIRKNIAGEPVTSQRCNQFTFDATGSYDPDKENIIFFWDLGDGTTSSEPVVEHTYNKSGDFNVTLSITDNSGLECSTAIVSQTVRANIQPKASFSAAEMVCANEPVSFDAASSYDDVKKPLGYDWDFGDGTRATGEAQVTKIFSKGGPYKIILTSDDHSATVCQTD